MFILCFVKTIAGPNICKIPEQRQADVFSIFVHPYYLPFIPISFTYTDYTLIVSSSWHSAFNASAYCRTTFGTNLGSFYNQNDINSYRRLANAHNVLNQPCWLGLYDTMGNNNGWQWLDSNSNQIFNLSSDTYTFNSDYQRCTYFYPYDSDINDWYCYQNTPMYDGLFTYTYWDIAYCFVCNKIARRNYTLTITTGDNSDA